MSKDIIRFINEYKKLDELCKQVLGTDKGVTSYIEEMEREGLHIKMAADYKKLKHLRYIRNKLVHDADSFGYELFDSEDIKGITDFRNRILELSDPLSRAVTRQKSAAGNLSAPKQHPEKKPSSKRGVIGFFIMLVATVIIMIVAYIKNKGM